MSKPRFQQLIDGEWVTLFTIFNDAEMGFARLLLRSPIFRIVD